MESKDKQFDFVSQFSRDLNEYIKGIVVSLQLQTNNVLLYEVTQSSILYLNTPNSEKLMHVFSKKIQYKQQKRETKLHIQVGSCVNL